jgi:hypothetical protein
MVLDPMTERFLSKWAQPNPDAKNDVIGRRRDATTTTVGGRRFTKEESNKSHAAIPLLSDPRNNVANSAYGTGVSLVPPSLNYHLTLTFDFEKFLTSDMLSVTIKSDFNSGFAKN